MVIYPVESVRGHVFKLGIQMYHKWAFSLLGTQGNFFDSTRFDRGINIVLQ